MMMFIVAVAIAATAVAATEYDKLIIERQKLKSFNMKDVAMRHAPYCRISIQ